MSRKNDANNIFNLAVGAVVGVLIYTAYSNHLRSYAAEATAINCDGPRPWSRRERARYETMTSTQRRRYLVTREQEFQRLCHEIAQEINSDQFAGSPMEQNLRNHQYWLKRGADPLYPQRAQNSTGLGLEYPTYDDTGKAFFEPSLPSQFGGNQAAFALAYAAKKKKKKAGGGGKTAKGGGGGKAKGGGGGGKDAGGDTGGGDAGGDTSSAPTDSAPTDTAAPAAGGCDCSCMPMDSDPSKFKIETADGTDCYNHVYPPSKAECETALKEVCAKRATGGADLSSAPDKTAKGGGGAADKGGGGAKGGGKKSKSAAYARAYAAYYHAYAAAKKKAAAGGGGKAAKTPAADDTSSTPTTKTPSAAPTAGGAPSSGKFPYPTTGKTWKLSDSGKSTRHYASGGSSGTTEWNADVGGVANIMGVVYYTHPSSCSGGHGDEADIKLWGPHHSNGGCCWCIVNINGAGDVCVGGEGPHPKTAKCRQKVGNVGSVAGKRVGLLHAISKGSGGAHSEVWIDTGGGFKKVGQYDGPCGNVQKSTTPSSGQQVQFRCDCSGVKVESANAYEVTPSGGGGGSSGPSATPAASKSPAATTPTKGGGKAPKTAAAAFLDHQYTVTIA
jgi:hypothetical protein